MVSVKLGILKLIVFAHLLQSPSNIYAADTDNQTQTTLYFGFFFDYMTSSSIKFATDHYLNSIVSSIPEFSGFLQNSSDNAGVSDKFNYYTRPVDPNTEKYDSYYHVTAKYCGNDQQTCAEYEAKNSEFINKTFEMHIVGYVLTNRTFGVRVNLTDEQLLLFENDGKDGRTPSKSKSLGMINKFENDIKSTPTKLSGGNLVTISLPGLQLVEMDTFPPTLPATSTKAHSTIGCAPRVSAVTTGTDLIQAIKYETDETIVSVRWEVKDPLDSEGRNMDVVQYSTTTSLFRQNAVETDFVFVIYPRVKLLANATLMHYYQNKPSTSGSARRFYYDLTFVIVVLITLNAAKKCLF